MTGPRWLLPAECSFDPVPAGFNGDICAFPSIPARHDLWRRAASDSPAGLVARGIVDMDKAQKVAIDAAYRLAEQAYRFD
jgi:glucuronate isomerase